MQSLWGQFVLKCCTKRNVSRCEHAVNPPLCCVRPKPSLHLSSGKKIEMNYTSPPGGTCVFSRVNVLSGGSPDLV